MTAKTKKKPKVELTGKALCEDRGYHSWSSIDSTSENFEDMEATADCDDCGATIYLYGDWELLDE